MKLSSVLQSYSVLQAAVGVLLLAPVLFPRSALAFDAIDVLQPSTSGIYPAYPSEPVPPYNLWGQLGMMYDSNILRRTSGGNGEFVTRLGLGGRMDQRVVGRQGLHLEGRLDGYVYNKFSELDNIAYGALGEWRYELGNDISGALGVSRRKFQANLSEIQRAVRDPITETTGRADARWRLGPHVGLRGGTGITNYNRPTRAEANTRTIFAAGGVDYVTDLGNTIGVEGQVARGDAPTTELVDPTGQFVNNDFRQRDVGLVGTWGVTPAIRVGGRIGRTTRRYTELPGRDFSGPTWNVAVNWTPTNKLNFAFESAKHVASIIDVGASHVIVKGFEFGPGWAPTAKLNFSGRLIRQHQTFEGDPAAALGVEPLRQEFIRGYRLGAYWEYDRHLHFQLAGDKGERESNILGRNYRYTAVMGQAKYLF